MRLTNNHPEYLNSLAKEWYENSADDCYCVSLLASAPEKKAVATENDGAAPTYGLIRDRKTAALLIGLLR